MKRAFSLIELLIIIAIVGILSAIAVPFYAQYKNKVKIMNAYNHVTSGIIQQILKTYHTTGSFPTTVNLGSSVDTNDSFLTESNNAAESNILTYMYESNGSRAAITITVSGLSGLPGYVDPASCSGGVPWITCGNAIMFAVAPDENGTVKIACGRDPNRFGPGSFIPTAYMPSACICASTYTNAYLNGNFTGC